MKKITKLLAGIVALSVATASLLTVISCSKEKEAGSVGFNGLFNYSAIGGISLLSAYTSEAVTERISLFAESDIDQIVVDTYTLYKVSMDDNV